MGGLRASARDQIAVTVNGHSWQAVKDVALVATWVYKQNNCYEYSAERDPDC